MVEVSEDHRPHWPVEYLLAYWRWKVLATMVVKMHWGWQRRLLLQSAVAVVARSHYQ